MENFSVYVLTFFFYLVPFLNLCKTNRFLTVYNIRNNYKWLCVKIRPVFLLIRGWGTSTHKVPLSRLVTVGSTTPYQERSRLRNLTIYTLRDQGRRRQYQQNLFVEYVKLSFFMALLLFLTRFLKLFDKYFLLCIHTLLFILFDKIYCFL